MQPLDIFIRKGPSTEQDKVGSAKANHKYEALAEQDGWYQIVLEDGTVGWISGKKCKLINGENISRTNKKITEQPYILTIDEFNKRFNSKAR